MTDATPPFSWRSIILPAYLPTLLFSIGEGAIIPVIPVVATDRGASLALAGLIAAMLMVGELAGDLPAGWLVARIGEIGADLDLDTAMSVLIGPFTYRKMVERTPVTPEFTAAVLDAAIAGLRATAGTPVA